MDECTLGLILRTRPLTETSLIVNWLTPDLGRLSTVAKGARRHKSPFAGKLDLFYLAEFSFQHSRRSELHTLREVSVREFHRPLRSSLGYLQQACYFAQLIEQTTEAHTPLPGLFTLVVEALQFLPHGPPQPLTVYAFEMKLLESLGLSPDLADSNLTPGSCELLPRLGAEPWALLSRLRLSSAQNNEISHFLHRFLIFHLGRAPRGRSAAVEC